jgi:hypothetical protein
MNTHKVAQTSGKGKSVLYPSVETVSWIAKVDSVL